MNTWKQNPKYETNSHSDKVKLAQIFSLVNIGLIVTWNETCFEKFNLFQKH